MVQNALALSSNNSEQHFQKVASCATAILFLGTPHHRAHAAHWAVFVARFTDVFNDTNREVFKVLQEDSPVLAAITHDFGQLMNRRQIAQSAVAITYFHEKYPIKTPAGTAVRIGSSWFNVFFVRC